MHLLPFSAWRDRLCQDCVASGKEREFQEIGDGILQLFWERGIEPTVGAIEQDTKDIA